MKKNYNSGQPNSTILKPALRIHIRHCSIPRKRRLLDLLNRPSWILKKNLTLLLKRLFPTYQHIRLSIPSENEMQACALDALNDIDTNDTLKNVSKGLS